MQVSVRANCWDGKREKHLASRDVIKVEGLPVVIQEARGKWWTDRRFQSVVSFGIPIMFISAGLPPIGLGRVLASALTPASVAQAPVVSPDDAVPAMSGLSGAAHAKILHAFDPLVNLIQDLAYPIAAVMIATGAIFIMVGNKEKGMQMLQHAALGYILVQLVPLMLSLLVGVGHSV